MAAAASRGARLSNECHRLSVVVRSVLQIGTIQPTLVSMLFAAYTSARSFGTRRDTTSLIRIIFELPQSALASSAAHRSITVTQEKRQRPFDCLSSIASVRLPQVGRGRRARRRRGVPQDGGS